MLEHIFRNIGDIRIFDMMVDFPETENMEEGDVVDIDEIMDILEYSEYKRMETADSIKHLVDSEILGIKMIKIEGVTGCKTCKLTDKFGIPRIGKHKSHKPEEVQIGEIDNYYMKDNEVTQLLRAATFKHITIMLEKEELENKK